MKVSPRFLSALMGIIIVALLPAQFQLIHDQPNTTTQPRVQPLILADGSIVTYQLNAGNHIFRKYDATGDLAWSRAFQGNETTGFVTDNLVSMVPDGASGFRFVRFVGFSYQYADTLWMDEQHTYTSHLVRVDANGDILSTHEILKEFDWFGSMWNLMDKIDLAIASDGGSIITCTFSHGGVGHIEIAKISVDGVMEWCRGVGDLWGTWPGDPFPSYSYDHFPMAVSRVGADGSINYAELGGYGYSHLRLGKLDANGNMLWMKRFVYGNTVNYIKYDDIRVDQGGSIHAVGTLVTTVGRFHIFLIVSPAGDLDRADIYRTPYVIQNKDFGIDSEGKRYHFVEMTLPNVSGNSSHGVLIADTSGSPAQFLRRDDLVILPNNVFIVPHAMDVRGSNFVLSGQMHHEHVDLAFTTRYESLLSLGTSAPYSCFMNDTALAHIPVPLEIMTTGTMENAVSADMMSFYTMGSDPAISLTTLPAGPMDTLCSFGYNLLGLITAIPEETSTVDLSLLGHTLVLRGTGIPLNDVGAARVEVWSINGTAITTMDVDRTSPVIQTSDLSPGIYLARAIDRNGLPVRMEKFMVQ